jgi:class 3 adenylate cyclase
MTTSLRTGAAPEVISPATRSLPGIPWWVWTLTLCAVALPVGVAARTQGVKGLDRLAQLAWALPACALVGAVAWRLERRAYLWLAGRSLSSRLKGTFGLILLAVVGAGLLGAGSYVLGDRYRPAFGLTPVIAAGAYVFLSAAAGSALTVTSALIGSAIARRFRSRLVLAVAPLLGVSITLSAGLAIWAHGRSLELLEQLEKPRMKGSDVPGARMLELATGPGKLGVIRAPKWVSLLRTRPGTTEAALFLAAALLFVPFLISAVSKLADEVMERLDPLTIAFDALAEGRRELRVEVGGSTEFQRLGEHFNRMVEALNQAERMERAYGMYVSRQVADRIRSHHGDGLLPAGLREASVLFADIRGFTSMSERRSPEVVVDVLNRYFDRVVALVNAHQGYLNKFIGDAVVVVFNGPIDQADHAERAVRFGIALQQMVDGLNQDRAFPELPQGIGVGVGMATGPMVCGNVGGGGQYEYTVIGDTVNLAARLTSKAGAGEVWINAEAARHLPDGIPALPLEPIKVKGKAFAIVPYRVWPSPRGAKGLSA